MCATAAKSGTERKSRSRTRSKTKVSSAKIEANRANSQKSCGPKSAEGKARSRFNALKHGLTAQTVVFPGEDSKAFQDRLHLLQNDLQPRNSLESTVIERLAGDIWRSDRADRAAGARLGLRLRHRPVDHSFKERDEAIELGQHLMWQPAFPLPGSAHEGEVKGASGKFPLANVPGDPYHPARLLLRLESTVAGCDLLLEKWGDLGLRLEGENRLLTSDGLKMIRLLGRTVLDLTEDYRVTLLYLDSMALADVHDPESTKKEPGREQTIVEWMKSVEKHDGRRSQVVDGMTRLCEPFAEALTRMPLEALAPENLIEARRRLTEVVERETRRIGEIRAWLQQIDDDDAAEAPARLAFETGTEGDRNRRYVLSGERLLNRRIEIFLKVRQASASGALDLVELEASIGKEKLEDLLAAGPVTAARTSVVSDESVNGASAKNGIADCDVPADLRSSDGRGRETRAQHLEVSVNGEVPVVSSNSELVCEGDSILRNEATEVANESGSRGRQPTEYAPDSEAAAPGARCTSQLDPSHPAIDASQDVDEPSLQTESPSAPNDLGGWGRLPVGDAPGTAAADPPGARRTSQLDPSHPVLLSGPTVEVRSSPQTEITAKAPPTDQVDTTAKAIYAPPGTAKGDPQGDHPQRLPAELPAAARAPATDPVTVARVSWYAHLSPDEVHNIRVAHFRATRGLGNDQGPRTNDE